PVKEPPPGQHYVATGFKQLVHTISTARRYPQTLLFLIAYLLYNDAIQAVIALASVFGSEELKLEQSTLVQVILMVQFAAFFGALLFNWVAKSIGNKRAIMASLVIWTGVLVYAYGLLQTKLQFFILGAAIAIVLGGSQALSRSVYSLMIPKGQEAEYFSLYEVSDKGTSWLAPLMFGLALQFTGSYRAAILSLVIFFAAGFAVLSKVNVRKAAIEAGNEAPAQS
ncbi:MAG TPA: MFS transporter, partial [Blastocatellia bacterium]|nr:MFS transporter [Blastocatellia bacterium]